MSAHSLQGKLAAATRHHPTDDHTELRKEFVTAKIAEYIVETVDASPPLDAEQRDRLALLLRGGGAHDAG